MKNPLQLACCILLLLFVTACQSSGVIQLSGDTYMISKSDAGPFATLSSVRSEVMKEVYAFAEKHGKIAVAVSTQSVPRSPGHVPYFEYQFRLLDRNDPRAQGVTLAPRPDYVVESTQNINANIKLDAPGKNRGDTVDLYTELTKLDDLGKRGLISDAEYEIEKKKLLERTK
jgi:hypothetical protein